MKTNNKTCRNLLFTGEASAIGHLVMVPSVSLDPFCPFLLVLYGFSVKEIYKQTDSKQGSKP